MYFIVIVFLHLLYCYRRSQQQQQTVPLQHWSLSATAFKKIRTESKILYDGLNFPEKPALTRVSPQTMIKSVEWVCNTCQFRPGKVRNYRLDGHILPNLPVFVRPPVQKKIFQSYRSTMVSQNHVPLGQKNFFKVLQALTEPTRQNAALSYFYVEHIDLIAELEEMLCSIKSRLPVDASATVQSSIKACETEIHHATNFLKYNYKHELKKATPNAFLCATFAVGGECDHQHVFDDTCPFQRTLNTFKSIHNLGVVLKDMQTDTTRITLEEIESILRVAEHTKHEILHYSKHIVRDWWQSTSIASVKTALSLGEGMVIIDHKQKVMPSRQNEAQTDYFGKRGMSVLGALLIVKRANRNGDIEYQHNFIDVVMKNVTSQRAVDLLPGIECILQEVKQTHNVNTVFIVSDNAGAFSSFSHIPFVYALNQQQRFAKVSQWLYSEPQCGKSMLDTHFAFMNIQLKRALLNNVSYMDQLGLFEALIFDGGIRGTTVFLATVLDTAETVHERCKDLISKQKGFSTGIRSIHALDFTNATEITAHHQTGLHPTHRAASIDWPKSFDATLMVEEGGIGRSADQRHLTTKQSTPKSNDDADADTTPENQPRTFPRALETAIKTSTVHLSSNSRPPPPPPQDPNDSQNTNSSSFIFKHWASKASRTWVKGDADIKSILQKYFEAGVKDIKNRVTAEVATRELKNGPLQYLWDKRCMYTVAKVKSVYNTLNAKQKKLADIADKNANSSASTAAPTPAPNTAVALLSSNNEPINDEQDDMYTDEQEDTNLQIDMLHAISVVQQNTEDVVSV